MNNKGVIYKLTFASGKSYIGLTTQTLKNRIKGHRFDALRRASPLPVHNAWRAHGEPDVCVLTEAAKETLCALEIDLIKEHQTLKPNGYNLSPGGEIPPAWIPGVAEKISKAAKLRGSLSPEHRDRIRVGLIKAYEDPELMARMSALRSGRVFSPEHRAKIGASNTGKTRSQETLDKLKLARNKRPPATAETRRRMSESHKVYRAAQRQILQSIEFGEASA